MLFETLQETKLTFTSCFSSSVTIETRLAETLIVAGVCTTRAGGVVMTTGTSTGTQGDTLELMLRDVVTVLQIYI